MNIVILQGAFFPIPPVMGGAVEKMWFKLGQEFAKQNHRVTHISRQHPELPESEIIEGVSHKRIGGYSAPKNMFKHKFLDAIYSWHAVKAIPQATDVVVTNTFWSPVFLRQNKQAVVYVDVARMPKMQMRLYSNADCLRANSNAVAEAIKSELPIDQHNRVSMIPNPLPFSVNEQIDLSAKQPIILFCGRIHTEKGLELLARAIKLIDLKEWKVQIVGPWGITMGGSGHEYKNYLIECCDNCNVEFLGPIFNETKLNEIYRNASIFVYPSLAEKGETFGLAPLEAMAWGAVPVVSNLSCFKDFILHKKNGMLFDHRSANAINILSDTLKTLIDDTQTRETLASETINVRKTHSTTHIAEQFLNDFDRLTSLKRCKA